MFNPTRLSIDAPQAFCVPRHRLTSLRHCAAIHIPAAYLQQPALRRRLAYTSVHDQFVAIFIDDRGANSFHLQQFIDADKIAMRVAMIDYLRGFYLAYTSQ